MGGYKKHKQFDMVKRKPIITSYSCIISIITMIVLGLFVASSYKGAKDNCINYTEKGNIDYKVYLQENEFFEKEYLKKENQYIASLIDYINAEFNYELESTKKDKDYKYMYRVESEINVSEKSTHNSIYTAKDELVPEKEGEFHGNSGLKINESLKIEYTKYNNLISRFVDVYDLDNSESSMTINMYVNILDEENTQNTEKPVMSLEIPLTTKTIAIDIVSNTLYDIEENVSQKFAKQKEVYIAIVLLIIDIILVIKLARFIYDTQNEKTIYRMKVRKILSNYGSYIQKINKEFDFEGYQSIELDSFERLLQIRDIKQEPILMLERKEEAYFMLPTQSKLIYMFELNSGNTKKRISEMAERKEIERV